MTFGPRPSLPAVRPRARTAALTQVVVDDELLIYDHLSYRCHRLHGRARALLEACDGTSGRDELAARLSLDDATCDALLVLLWDEELLEGLELEPLLSRRAALRTWARAITGGVVASLAVPAAAQSSSCVPLGFPTGGRPCCPGLIRNVLGICIPL